MQSCRNICLLESASTITDEISFTRRRREQRNDGIVKVKATFVPLISKLESRETVQFPEFLSVASRSAPPRISLHAVAFPRANVNRCPCVSLSTIVFLLNSRFALVMTDREIISVGRTVI